MLYPVEFKAEHYEMMSLQPNQEWMRGKATVAGLRSVEGPHAYTLMDDGKPIACCGAIPLDQIDHRAYVWSFLSTAVAAGQFREIHSWAKKFIESLPHRRLEAATDVDFAPGRRWLRALGFTLETPVARAYRQDGGDCALYVLVREAA